MLYTRLPFYRRMWESAGHSIEPGNPTDKLVDELVISGDKDRLQEIASRYAVRTLDKPLNLEELMLAIGLTTR